MESDWRDRGSTRSSILAACEVKHEKTHKDTDNFFLVTVGEPG
jgi:hypothetical protein